jgi:Transposase DDE domain group 1
MTSDGGSLLLREIDQATNLTSLMSRSLLDRRDMPKVHHGQEELLRQRLFGIAMGYEDANDHKLLRFDPGLKTAVGRLPETGPALASQPTLSRFENGVGNRELRRLADALMDAYVAAHPAPRKLIVVDIDSTDDPTHGMQQLSFFHGYYDQYMLHPLLVFDGLTGFPMAAVLRAGNAHASKGAAAVLKRIIRRLKRAYPKATILVRADAGFAVPGIYRRKSSQGI